MIEPIELFTDRYRFLSNFYWSPIARDGLVYPTVEHAYQAAKCLLRADRVKISELAKPGAAKRMGRTVVWIAELGRGEVGCNA